MKTTIKNLHGNHEYINLPRPMWSGKVEIGTGVTANQIFVGPRTGRKFLESYSCWDNGHGMCVGLQTREIDDDEYLRLCQQVGIDPIGIIASPI
jgi:hypothetical protein